MIKITVNDNGPLRIEGAMTICDPTGKEYGLAGRTVVSLAICFARPRKSCIVPNVTMNGTTRR